MYPSNMHTFCCFLFCGEHIMSSWRIYMIHSPISFRVASLVLGQSYDCPISSEVTLWDMEKSDWYQSTTISKQYTDCVYTLLCMPYIIITVWYIWDEIYFTIDRGGMVLFYYSVCITAATIVKWKTKSANNLASYYILWQYTILVFLLYLEYPWDSDSSMSHTY